MVNIILHGCSGKMGSVVENIVSASTDCKIVAGIDARDSNTSAYPVFKTAIECHTDADVIIDFSIASAVPALLDFAKDKKIPVVLCTTGLSPELIEELQVYSKDVALLKSANMSLGVNLMLSLVKRAAEMLYDSNFDIEIVEKHHNQKIDAPSGTALALADNINSALDNKMNYTYDRSQTREKRDIREIGIHAVRGGTIVGEHDVIFAGKDEILTINHTAMSKEIFAVGAVKAAKFLAGKPAGFYTMENLMD